MTRFHSLIEAVANIKSKKISAQEITAYCLQNIQKLNPRLNALITVCASESLSQARQIDHEIATGQNLARPLLGIPIVMKDMYSTENVLTTAASRVLADYIPLYDATVVRKLKEAGCILIGKANQDAWAHGSSGENSDYGPSLNPFDNQRIPGGSSSGSAVALASDMCLASTGTDTGGSIRYPSGFCNVVGIKPTYGRVSRYGIISMASSFDTIGHMTKTVADNALILEVTAGKDPYDATSADAPVETYSKQLDSSLRGKKIGVISDFLNKGIEIGMKKLFLETMETYKSMGAEIIEINIPHIENAMACYYILVPSEISSNLARYDGIRFGNGRKKFSDEAKRRIMIGTYALSAGYYDAYYKKALRVRTLIREGFKKAFQNVDVIITPSSPTKPFFLGEKTADPLAMYLSDIYMCPISLAGLPSLNIPMGKVDNLPVGMQIIGNYFRESTIYQFAYQFESNMYHG